MLICNAFSLNMLAALDARLKVREVSLDEARALAAEGQSAVGHADTAAVFSAVLGVSVPAARTTVRLASGDAVLVGQYVGPRLPEGATVLPEGATIRWAVVTVEVAS